MNFNKFIILTSILFILTVSIGTISASDISDNQTGVLDGSLSLMENNNKIVESSQNDLLSDSAKTVVVPFNPSEPNEMTWPKIQPAIDEANAGDTIIIEGNPAHCRLAINKKLNIIAGEGANITPCPANYHEGLSQFGVFYIPKEGSGSTIQGFTFLNTHKSTTPFAIFIDGADDITIKDCIIDFNAQMDYKFSGIIIKNSNNIKLSNLIINNTINGITIINSSNIDITNSIISYNVNQAISISGDSKNININSNQIKNNGNSGINLSSANNVNVINNYIENNGIKNRGTGSGIYVNTNITKLIVKGNVFLSNGLHAIMYDYRTRNLNKDSGADQLTIVDNNYFSGHDSMVLHHRTYIEYPDGDLKYDAENDVYGSVGEGSYIEKNSYVYMQHALVHYDILCGFTYYTPDISWSLDAVGNMGQYNLSLKLVINQVKNGVYQASIVDNDGNVATDFSSFYITFFLNDYTTMNPKQGEIYKKVLISNGVAIADFRDVYSSFKASGNVVTAVIPGLFEEVNRNIHAQLHVRDSEIPIDPMTTLTASELTTYPLSDSYFSAKLTNSRGKSISNQLISFKINGKIYTAKTDDNGIAKVKVSLTSKKTYDVIVGYLGNDDYKSTQVIGKIIVKTGSKKSKIKASNVKFKKNKKKTFKLKLTSGAGKVLKNQKITVKVNGKASIIKTNKKGIAKISLKFKKAGKYKITMKFLGNSEFKPATKINKITVNK